MSRPPSDYTSLPSLEAYIVASQDEPICWLWQRGADRAFSRLPEAIKGREAAIALTAHAIPLPLAEIYRGIGAAWRLDATPRAQRIVYCSPCRPFAAGGGVECRPAHRPWHAAARRGTPCSLPLPR